MTPKKEIYERVSERAKKGNYQLAVPLDYFLIGFLPNQGELFAGLYPMGETVSNILKKFPPEQQNVLDTKTLSARLRVLHQQDLVEPVYAGSSSRGKIVWQRTPAAVKILQEWKKETNGGSSGSDS